MTFPLPPLPGMPYVASVPAGAVIAFAGRLEHLGWMLCDGRVLSMGDYGELYKVIGSQYNKGGEASGYFRIPDYRGYFLRMTDLGSDRDPDVAKRKLTDGSVSKEVGSIQEDALQTHQHIYQDPVTATIPAGSGSVTAVTTMPDQLSGTPTDSLANPPGTVRTSTETRSKNVYVNYLIKVF